ncbi:MAG: ABC transporter permease [Lachnospiraceae bacterium]|nr:ABC transporter permease [Lachnospiraceae bacterium]
MNNIASSQFSEGALLVETEDGDPYTTAETGPHAIAGKIAAVKGRNNLIKNIFYAAIADLAFLALFIFRKRFSTLPTELIQNRKLILQLAKNDFKTKYAGSVFGIIWAFIQPTVTVVVYWFVFQVGLGSGNVTSQTGVTYPFVLWLISGLVPWFFFQDVLIGGTSALMEYTYLVKKVVFKISILPIVKEISALFVHLFFIGLMLVLYAFGGFLPDLKVLQVLYYSFCLFMYGLGVCYATCSIVVFFRDLTQIISIIIQIQVWMTPIMWNIDTLGARMPSWLITIFKLNPMYYIVNGYRDAMINKVWFWERFDLTIYFWIVTGVFFVIGAYVFKRLKVHFADTL